MQRQFERQQREIEKLSEQVAERDQQIADAEKQIADQDAPAVDAQDAGIEPDPDLRTRHTAGRQRPLPVECRYGRECRAVEPESEGRDVPDSRREIHGADCSRDACKAGDVSQHQGRLSVGCQWDGAAAEGISLVVAGRRRYRVVHRGQINHRNAGDVICIVKQQGAGGGRVSGEGHDGLLIRHAGNALAEDAVTGDSYG